MLPLPVSGPWWSANSQLMRHGLSIYDSRGAEKWRKIDGHRFPGGEKDCGDILRAENNQRALFSGVVLWFGINDLIFT